MVKKDILSTKNLTVGYSSGKKTIEILKNVNLDLHKEELVCIIGPNGSGKSTLLRSLSNLQKPLAGQVFLHNKPIENYSRKEFAQNISLVLTERVSNLNLTVKELITLGRYPYTNFIGKLLPEDEAKVNEAINNTNLCEISDSKINELSDGQIQKVMVARALAQEGQILILDEPTAHLDLNNRVEIMTLLKKISRNSEKTILLSTHDLDLALETADRFWLTYNQEVIEGAPEDLAVNGILSSVFKSANYHFNIESGRFIMKRENNNAKVNLLGPEPFYFWTKHALEKEGISISQDSQVSIHIKEEESKIIWSVNNKKNKTLVLSIKELISFVKEIFKK